MRRHRFNPDCPCRSCQERREAYAIRHRPEMARRRADSLEVLERSDAVSAIRDEAYRLFPVLTDPNSWSDPTLAEQARAGALWLRERLGEVT